MEMNEYQKRALITVARLSETDTILMCALGLAGESGEIVDVLKKHYFHHADNTLDYNKIIDEMGDLLWYMSVMCSMLGITMNEVMERNIEKLSVRHGGTFNPVYVSDNVKE